MLQLSATPIRNNNLLNRCQVLSFSAAKAENDIDNKLGQVKKEIDAAGSIAIFQHVDPDSDAIGSSVALKNLIDNYAKNNGMKKKVVIYVNEEYPESFDVLDDLKKFKEENKLIILTKDNEKEHINEEYALAIALDSSGKSRLGRAEAIFDNAKRTVKIDHHSNKDKNGKSKDYADVNLIDENSSSTGDLIMKLADKMKVDINKNMASALFIGKVGDTSGFSNSKNFEKDFGDSERLAKAGIDAAGLYATVMYKTDKSMVNYRAMVLNNLKYAANNQIVYIAEDEDFIKKMPEKIKKDKVGRNHVLKNVSSTTLPNIKGVKIVMRVVPSETKKDCVEVCLRGNGIPVEHIGTYFGGGGHRYPTGVSVAGFPLKNMSVKEATKKVLKFIKATGVLKNKQN